MSYPIYTFEFEGNTFFIQQKPYNDVIIRIEMCSDTLTIPTRVFLGRYDLDHVKEINLKTIDKPEKVVTLVLAKDSIPIKYSFPLPNLMHLNVEKGNHDYSTDGRSLLTWDGSILLRYLTLGDSSPYVVPKSITQISSGAFQGSQMTSISFPTRVKAPQAAFTDSAWLAKHKDLVVVGDTIISVNAPLDILEMTDGVSCLSPGAMGQYKPSTIICDRLPEVKQGNSPVTYETDTFMWFPKKLVFTNKFRLPEKYALLPFGQLEDIIVQEDHPTLKTQDGILYSKDGKTLLYCPPRNKVQHFQVPEGVTKIASYAFFGHKNLQSISFPASVTQIGLGAFAYCRYLQEVHLPENLAYLPDVASESVHGVFEQCDMLTKVTFGRALKSIGDDTFKYCKLTDVVLPDGLLRLGHSSLSYATGSIRLPKSLMIVEKDALSQMEHIYVHEGTAKGPMNATGNQAYIHVQSESEENICTFPSLGKRVIKEMAKFNEAWDGDQCDFAALASCYSFFTVPEQKQAFALSLLSAFPEREEMQPLRQYLYRVAGKMATTYIVEDKPEDFLKILRLHLLSETTLKSLLNTANKHNKPVMAAYILDYTEAKKKQDPKSKFPL